MSSALKKNSVASEILTPEEMVRFAREHSPFYKELYKDLPDIFNFKDIPLIPLEKYWQANQIENNQVFTQAFDNGLIFRSGGTTGNPKYSYITHAEWKILIQEAGRTFALGHFESGDRVANLYHAGNMYGAFVYTLRVMEDCPLNLLQLPIGGHIDLPSMLTSVRDFKANVIVSFPTTIMAFAEHFAHNPLFDKHQIKKVFFAGEPFLKFQNDRLKEIFPDVEIHSIAYGSSDAGMLGYSAKDCAHNEHRVFSNHTVLELVDPDTGNVITEMNREGNIVVTNLFQKLMPVIRYPVGDKGMWVEPQGIKYRKYKLLGRSEEVASIVGIKFYISDVRDLLESYRQKLQISDFQIVIGHREEKQFLKIRIATRSDIKNLSNYSDEIISALAKARPLYHYHLDTKIIHPMEIEWTKPEELHLNPRTGKMLRVIDKRQI